MHPRVDAAAGPAQVLAEGEMDTGAFEPVAGGLRMGDRLREVGAGLVPVCEHGSAIRADREGPAGLESGTELLDLLRPARGEVGAFRADRDLDAVESCEPAGDATGHLLQ